MAEKPPYFPERRKNMEATREVKVDELVAIKRVINKVACLLTETPTTRDAAGMLFLQVNKLNDIISPEWWKE